jgi:hypothetical protein
MKTDEGALRSALLEEAETWPLYGYCCLTEELLRVNFLLKQADVYKAWSFMVPISVIISSKKVFARKIVEIR